MHPDIEKLINLAKETGELTEKQREIILRKAKLVGEDVDEVEMLLETIKPIVKKRTAPQKQLSQYDDSGESEESMTESDILRDAQHLKRKCPNCGCLIPGFSMTCPDCGYVFQQENESSLESRNAFGELQDRLLRTRGVKTKAAIINSFVMPNTKESLLQLLILAYSNYDTGKGVEKELIRRAWLSKAVQAYQLLKAQAKSDEDVAIQLEKYRILDDKKAVAKLSGKRWKLAISVLVAAVLAISACLMLYYLTASTRSYKQSVRLFKSLAIPGQDLSAEQKLIELASRENVSEVSIFKNENVLARYEYNSEGLTKYYLLQDDFNLFSKREIYDKEQNLKKELFENEENCFYSQLHQLQFPFLWLNAYEIDCIEMAFNMFWEFSKSDDLFGCPIQSIDYDDSGNLSRVISNGAHTYTISYKYSSESHLIETIIEKEQSIVYKFFFDWVGDRIHEMNRYYFDGNSSSKEGQVVFKYDTKGDLVMANLFAILSDGKRWTNDIQYKYTGEYVYASYGYHEFIFVRDADEIPVYGIHIIRPEETEKKPWQY